MYSMLNFTSAIGCLAGPLALGALGGVWGLRPAFGTLAAVPVVLVVLSLLLLEARRPDTTAQDTVSDAR